MNQSTDSFVFQGVKYVCSQIGDVQEGMVNGVNVIASNGLISDYLDGFWDIPQFVPFMRLFSENLRNLTEQSFLQYEATTNTQLTDLQVNLMAMHVGALVETKALCGTIETVLAVGQENLIKTIVDFLIEHGIAQEDK